jgi:hypothetical protein
MGRHAIRNISVLFAYFSYFEKINVGLLDHIPESIFMELGTSITAIELILTECFTNPSHRKYQHYTASRIAEAEP